MAARKPDLAVAFVIREKFSCSLPSLERLYALAEMPFTLYFVDSVYPPEARQPIERFLAGKANVVHLRAARFLYPSEALNLVVQRATEPLLFLLQNDVLIGRGAPAQLARGLESISADFAVPAVLDIENGAPAPHRDEEAIAFVERDGKVHGLPEREPRWQRGLRRLDYFEMHCFLARTQVLKELGPLPPLNMHEHVDLCVALWRTGLAAYADRTARVLYVGAPPVALRSFETPYYRFRWDPVRAKQSDRYVREKWQIAELFDAMHFIGRQQQALAPDGVMRNYDSAFEIDAWPDRFASG